MTGKLHWEQIYGTKAPDSVSWYAPHLVESLGYIEKTGAPKSAAILDVGGGESTLVDDLLNAGYDNVAVLDLSETALQVSKRRLGSRADGVRWLAADVLRHSFTPHSIDVWHDRAVFHFLTSSADRDAYVQQVLRTLKPGGHCIVGTFGPAGPERCSGLPVQRYDAGDLHGEFGGRFQLLEHSVSTHITPWGSEQQFVYCYCRLEH
ncbi:hypothetical protein AZ34_02515 [Hylemonella gracilis str. Niagara R]|uniref:Methyltransferase type 11 domain-containing protein n=1 Tax=Hylemonella gracilis str. Niagara R TaxID=1458275 RepID=A0A016XDA8_9BURK|nr:class I SAM-dependent methyltransferase [Hylemonella gracilis]EYC50059.1 hypothetical protein AZ34_02515 [Hylemonella gracilis str. Niagara R]